MKKKNNGCLWFIILLLVLVFLLVTIFIKVAPKTAQNAKDEVIERLFGVSVSNETKDTVVIDSVFVPQKVDTIKVKDEYIKIPIKVVDNTTYVVAKLNNADVRFILDTGCTDIQITVAEFYYLKHLGHINENDLGEKVKCTYANGEERECHTVNIKSLKIGGIELSDVKCTVEENIDAPLLLGQTVLQKLGEVTIDYKNEIIKIRK